MMDKVPHRLNHEIEYIELNINKVLDFLGKYLCAWGNDAASEVLTEARLLLGSLRGKALQFYSEDLILGLECSKDLILGLESLVIDRKG
ncbi:hypothetical protein VNO80_17252 [Phaseolus coccineus]|uniref:Uncharacterized protein n=1 Tax=Phaseolus coccineus TaxID=3886 RepID=A0AAN9MNG5_PHACN